MTLKIQKTALENNFDNGNYLANSLIKEQICNLIQYKISGLSKGMIIPDNLIAEAEEFMNRNRKEEMYYRCCPRCLKAHLIKKADELELTKKEKAFLLKIIPEEEGHNGYYMDGEELIEIEV